MEIIKQQPLNKNILKNLLREFIEDSRQNIEYRINLVNIILLSMKEENELLIAKSIF